MLNYYQEQVQEFQKAFEMPEDEALWKTLIDEEYKESVEAAEHLLKELADLQYVTAGLANIVGLAKAVEYVSSKPGFSTLAQFIITGVGESTLCEAFDRVHESNMSKLGDNGKPIRREDGKILKGPNYKVPVLTDLIETE